MMKITPYQYEFLTPAIKEDEDTRKRKIEGIKEEIKKGTPVAMVQLDVEISKEYPKTLIITNHEGRHRARALKEIGAETIPVILTGSVPEDLTGWQILEQNAIKKREPLSANKLDEWGK